jgi:hypothetical protein
MAQGRSSNCQSQIAHFPFPVLAVIFGLCAHALLSADTWWHLATGRWIAVHRAVPLTDPFSFTAAGQRWIAHEYLADLAMYGLHRGGGLPALVLANAALLTLAFWLVWRRCRGPAPAGVLALLLGIWAARPTFALRPQTCTLVFGAVFLWLLDRHTESFRHQAASSKSTGQRSGLELGAWSLWLLLPLLMLLWVQLHAGYVLGLALIAFTAVADMVDRATGRSAPAPQSWRAPLVSLALCAAVVPLNPNGFALYRFPFELLRMRVNQYILEWRSPPFSDPRYWPFLGLAFLTLLALMFSAQKCRPGQYLLFTVFLAAALNSRRNIPVFVLIAVPLLAEHARWPRRPVTWLAGVWARLSARAGRSAVLAAAGRVAAPAVLAAAVAFCIWQTRAAIQGQRAAESAAYPADAVRFLANHPLPDNLINAYQFGGYMIWRLPGRKVFIDGRADLYGDAFLQEFVEIYRGYKVPDSFLDHWQVRTAILEPGSGLAGVLAIETGGGKWSQVYQDSHAVIFVRK